MAEEVVLDVVFAAVVDECEKCGVILWAHVEVMGLEVDVLSPVEVSISVSDKGMSDETL
ncbi:hypothetical protein Lalb_Chr23g0269181 [Lupinus albus]|uniref:Uncharacterized protein n=1 Tax=Lupinus albus TaxID=3870 RepID=A0A6A4NE81_LUPAL|nr:hypothetical protein Lalb_Chr23g0269181 [Lupinus albus]